MDLVSIEINYSDALHEKPLGVGEVENCKNGDILENRLDIYDQLVDISSESDQPNERTNYQPKRVHQYRRQSIRNELKM